MFAKMKSVITEFEISQKKPSFLGILIILNSLVRLILTILSSSDHYQ